MSLVSIRFKSATPTRMLIGSRSKSTLSPGSAKFSRLFALFTKRSIMDRPHVQESIDSDSSTTEPTWSGMIAVKIRSRSWPSLAIVVGHLRKGEIADKPRIQIHPTSYATLRVTQAPDTFSGYAELQESGSSNLLSIDYIHATGTSDTIS